MSSSTRDPLRVLRDRPAPDVVASLDAEAAVRRVMTAYMAACDAHDAHAVAELFHDDATWVSLNPDAGEPLHGPDEVRAEYAIACARLTFCVHFLTNEQIDVVDDRARARWSYFEPATNRGDLAVWTAGRYDHDLERRDGVWKFSTFRIMSALAARYGAGWVPDHQIRLT